MTSLKKENTMNSIAINDIPEQKDLQIFLEGFIHDWNFSISISYQSIFWNTPKLRSLMETLLGVYDIDVKDKNRLVLVSDELNNNAVEHGTWDYGDNIIDIVVRKESENKVFINIEVTDCGNWSAKYMEQLKHEKEVTWFEGHRSIRWRGLFLITEKIVDKIYFKDSKDWGLIVWIEKTL